MYRLEDLSFVFHLEKTVTYSSLGKVEKTENLEKEKVGSG